MSLDVVCSDGKIRKARIVGLQLFVRCAQVTVKGKTVTGYLMNEIDWSVYPGKATGRIKFWANADGKNAHLITHAGVA